MSMDKLAPGPSSSMVIADTDMSDAVDQDLALGTWIKSIRTFHPLCIYIIPIWYL